MVKNLLPPLAPRHTWCPWDKIPQEYSWSQKGSLTANKALCIISQTQEQLNLSIASHAVLTHLLELI